MSGDVSDPKGGGIFPIFFWGIFKIFDFGNVGGRTPTPPPPGGGGRGSSPDISDVEDFENPKKKIGKNFPNRPKLASYDHRGRVENFLGSNFFLLAGSSWLDVHYMQGTTIVRDMKKIKVLETLKNRLSPEVIEKTTKSRGD